MATISQTLLTPAAHTDTGPVLSLSNITHDFGDVRAVDDVSLDVMPGEVVCLLGPSGCGKSTLLRLAAGLETLQAGAIRLQGRTVALPKSRQLPPEQRNLGLMFQDSALFPHLKVIDNVTFGLDGVPPSVRRQRGLEILEKLGLESYADSYPHLISGGQQQRVALARALAPKPALMLLDEPFSALDARLRELTRDDTLHVLKNSGAGTLMVTHDPEEAMFMADRIALMRDGRIIQLGTPYDLYCHPAEPFVVRFFGEVNEVQAVVENGEVHCAFGTVPAPQFCEGTRVRMLIRPEAVSVRLVSETRNHYRSHVVVSRLLGRTSLLHLCVHTEDGGEFHGHSRMPGVFLPAPDQPVAMELDPSQVFLFPIP
ncbi:MAG: ABC transporter ATP-binding protein [Gammaproteobacteria bacterium]|nr:ABC transporter ATP-binding protein [Gammaproteobacteria bacterium]